MDFSKIKSLSLLKYNELSTKEQSQHYTTLCTFSLVSNETVLLCALGTGTKAVGNDQLKDGYKLHSCHAEVIAKRAFQFWIYQNLKNTTYFEPSENSNKLKLKDNWQVAVYISQPPCGQCSLHNESQVYGLSAARPFADFSCPIVGEKNLDPRRLRYTPTNSKTPVEHRNPSFCCSDKIMFWTALGVQGSLLNLLIQPIYISTILVDCRELLKIAAGLNLKVRSGRSANEVLRIRGKKISKEFKIRKPGVYLGMKGHFIKSPFHCENDKTNKRIQAAEAEASFQSFSFCFAQPSFFVKINSLTGLRWGVVKKDEKKIHLLPFIAKPRLFALFLEQCKLNCGEEELEDSSYREAKEKNVRYACLKKRIQGFFQEWSPSKVHLENFTSKQILSVQFK